MSRTADFFTCDGCGEFLMDQYADGELIIDEPMIGYLRYKCPICGKQNVTKTRKRYDV